MARRRSASGAKTDTIDAYLLAKMGRSDLADLRRLTPDSEAVQELKTLTRDQDALIQMQTRLVNQLTACLKAYYPVALQLFTKLQQHSTLIFLQTYPTPQAAMAASVEQIAQVLKSAGHTTAAKVAPTIFESLHQPQLVANAITTRTKARLMLALVAQLLPLVEQIAIYDKEIERLFLTHEDNEVFTSLPGAGKRLAPRLLAEIGDDRSRYAAAVNLQARARTSPVLFQSGTYHKAHRRLACMKPLRNALQQFAWQSTRAVRAGPGSITSANELRGKATPSLCGLLPISGSVLSSPCGKERNVTSLRPLPLLNKNMRARLPELRETS